MCRSNFLSSFTVLYLTHVGLRVKTKVQQRALAGIPPRSVFETFKRMLRGGDPNSPKPLLVGLTRLYQGLGTYDRPCADGFVDELSPFRCERVPEYPNTWHALDIL
jgi:hypothetical protein